MSLWSDFTVQTFQKPQKDEFADSNRASVIFQLMQKDAPQCKWIISTNKQQNKQTQPCRLCTFSSLVIEFLLEKKNQFSSSQHINYPFLFFLMSAFCLCVLCTHINLNLACKEKEIRFPSLIWKYMQNDASPSPNKDAVVCGVWCMLYIIYELQASGWVSSSVLVVFSIVFIDSLSPWRCPPRFILPAEYFRNKNVHKRNSVFCLID